jgi:hypothetical protein
MLLVYHDSLSLLRFGAAISRSCSTLPADEVLKLRVVAVYLYLRLRLFRYIKNTIPIVWSWGYNRQNFRGGIQPKHLTQLPPLRRL